MKKKLLLVQPRNDRAFTGKVSRKGKAGFAGLALPTVAALTPADRNDGGFEKRPRQVSTGRVVRTAGGPDRPGPAAF